VIDTLDLAVDSKITTVWSPLPPRHSDSMQSSPELTTYSPVYQGVVKIGLTLMVHVPIAAAEMMNAHMEMPNFVQSHNSRSLIDTLDLAVDRKITATGSPLSHRHSDGINININTIL